MRLFLENFFQNDSIQVIFTLQSVMKEEEKQPTYTEDYNEAISKSNLRPDYTFENFIVGESNKHAHATCLAVADSPGQDKF